MKASAPIPHIVVHDGAAAVAFYERAFGATLVEQSVAEDGKRLMHAHLRVGAGALYLNDEFSEFSGHGGAGSPKRLGAVSCVLHLDVPDADAAWQRAVDAGAEVVMELADQFWGMRYGQIRDPLGQIWSIGGPLAETSAPD